MNQNHSNETARILGTMPNLSARSFELQAFDSTSTQEATSLADAVQAAVCLLSVAATAGFIRNVATGAKQYVARFLFSVAKTSQNAADFSNTLLAFATAVTAAAIIRAVEIGASQDEAGNWKKSSSLATYLSMTRTVYAALNGQAVAITEDDEKIALPAMPQLRNELSLEKAYKEVQKAKKAAIEPIEAKAAQAAQQAEQQASPIPVVAVPEQQALPPVHVPHTAEEYLSVIRGVISDATRENVDILTELELMLITLRSAQTPAEQPAAQAAIDKPVEAPKKRANGRNK